MTQAGGLFIAIGGFAITCFAVFAVIAILLRLYLAFEGFIASKLAEDAGADWADGDWPAIPDECRIHARSNTK